MGRQATSERYVELFPHFVDAMRVAGVGDETSAAMWFAQLGHESIGLSRFRELYDGNSKFDYFEAKYGHTTNVGRNSLGNVNPGDGGTFYGRGAIQLTGRHNYTRFGEWTADRGLAAPGEVLANPDIVEGARFGMLAAAWYWSTQSATGRAIPPMAAAGDLDGVTRAINGGTNGIDDRRRRFDVAKTYGARLLPGNAEEADEEMALLDIFTRKRKSQVENSTAEFDLPDYIVLIDYHVNHLREDVDALGKALTAVQSTQTEILARLKTLGA